MLVDKPISIFHRRRPVITMIKGVFIFSVGLLAYIWSAPTTLESVWIKDVTRFQSDKRTLIDLDLPNELTFHLMRGSKTLTLSLNRNHAINPDAGFYFVRKEKDGQSVLVKTRTLKKEDVAYYQDRKNGAFMMVRCVNKSNKHCDRIINGYIRIGDSMYSLLPEQNDVKSRKLMESGGRLVKPYVLKQESTIQRDMITEMKDAVQVNEDIRSLLQRFQGQHKENHFPSTDATLSSRNVAALHNRAETDKSRQLKKKTYDVNVAVLIDSALWELFSSFVPILNPTIKRRNVMGRIRQDFSNIMNGVNLLYQGIEDPSISINVFLTDIIVFKRNSFPHKLSEVVKINGTNYIEAENYLNDLKTWDAKAGLKNERVYDHGMLFTRYKLYVNYTQNNAASGLTFRGRVCDIGKKTSIVEAHNYFWMVSTAAHELGHSLGAYHDGELGVNDCKALDFFIMSYLEPKLNQIVYSRNPWLFSNCSVKAFKDTLKHKKCMTKPGRFYDYEEYKEFVSKEQGEVYSPDEQCRFILGRNSECCETDPADICQAMRCRDPKTKICKSKYFGAVRGTECGQDRWCIEGRCVSKV